MLTTPAGKPRARALSIPFDGAPGLRNAITDVAGVSVGSVTLISGDGPLITGRGPVRTGVTAILPRPPADALVPVFAGFHSQNGNGEMTGAHMIAEVGAFTLPITITNTHACGIARDATIGWINRVQPGGLDDAWGLPVAAETYDGFLNDINGGHVTAAHVEAAIDAATDGPIEEGSVGGGTGMIAFAFKAGSGTASRRVRHKAGDFIVGAFVQANFGKRRNLTVRGRRLGEAFAEPALVERTPKRDKSSIIGVIATDAPLLPHQLARLARRAPLGVALTGGYAYHSSGDIFLAFSTANRDALTAGFGATAEAAFLADSSLDPFFDAVIEATEEAILNALVANADMTGRDGNFVPAIPRDRLAALFA
ncbi:MAG: P1 family peptidase [Bauldia sp.]|nr:P1 family peptidase [Bauldia sp.]